MKYELTDETKIVFGRTLHKIVCVTAFANVAAGEACNFRNVKIIFLDFTKVLNYTSLNNARHGKGWTK